MKMVAAVRGYPVGAVCGTGRFAGNLSARHSKRSVFQVGLVTLIGLAAKNAILIVEFAVMEVQRGLTYAEAAVSAAKLRFRPIVMTSLAFTFGVLPLAISTGAGAGSRHAIGTGMIGGMILSTFVATLFVPMMFAIIGETFDEENILRRKISKRAKKLGRPQLKGKLR